MPARPDGQLDLAAISPDDASRALLLWVNSPSNPTGALDDLDAAADWGRTHGVPVFSDECYVEFTWSGRGRTILERGTDGVVAVHSLSKRSNLAGLRVGFYAGDAELVHYLQEVRKHVGMMVPGPAQAAGVAALDDDAHVEVQRERYHRASCGWPTCSEPGRARRWTLPVGSVLSVDPDRRRLGVRRAARRRRGSARQPRRVLR